MIIYKLLYFIPLLFFFCVEPNSNISSQFPVEPLNSFLPASAGIYWVYEEDYTDADTHSVRLDTTFITGTEVKNGEQWYLLENRNCFATNILSDRFMLKKDSVFSRQYNWNIPVTALIFPKPGKDITQYNMLTGGDTDIKFKAVFSDRTVFTRLGKYKGYAYYYHEGPEETITYKIVPGIGIVEKRQEGRSFTGQREYLWKCSLVDIHIP
ncbi:MAG: hypothetical protein WAN36_06535 [Calditrichia bacterium]